MIDLIDRQLAIDKAKKLLDCYGTNAIIKEFADIVAEKFMNLIPSAGVVHCKDCKHYKTKYCRMDVWHEDVTIYRALPDDYCSRGKRKE